MSDDRPSIRPMSDGDRRLLAGRHPLAAELAVSFRERCRIVGGRILVAVSGGPDSLALLWLASALADREAPGPRWEPIVAHVDHGLRAGSEIERRFVESQALAAGLSFESATVDCRGPGNVSDRARRARYEALERIALARGCVAIATAHHAEDRLESILIGLGRGRGLEAFLAMPATRPIGDGLMLARPLLGVSNAALLECCRRLELDPIRDPSNTDLRRLRARLRQVVMPELEAILPGASIQAGAIVEEASLAAAAIERWLADTFGSASTSQWSREALASLPCSLRVAGLSRAVREALRERDPAAIRAVHRRSLAAIAEAIGDQERRPRCWPLGGLLEAEVDHRHVVLRRRSRTVQGDDDSQGPRHAAT